MRNFVLRFAGIYHDDAECRDRLVSFLEEAKARYSDPAFVALEVNDDLGGEIECQRDCLREKMETAWGSSYGALADELARLFAYEADTHRGVFPKAVTVPLDHGRLTVWNGASSLDAVTAVRTAAATLLQFCTSCIDGSSGRPDSDREKVRSALTDRRHRLECEGDVKGKLVAPEHWSDGRCMPRDQIWVERLRAAMLTGANTSDWGLVIVGARHCDSDADSVLRLLATDTSTEASIICG